MAGELGAAMVKGYQGEDNAADTSVMACVKHYIGYGEATGARDSYDTSISVRIEEKTNYPFEDTIAFSFNAEQSVAFTLSLRIPEWSNGATVTVNGKEEHTEKNGEFYRINHTFDNRDEILLKLYPKIDAVTSADDGIYLTRGPLVFALGLPYKEARVKAEGGDGTLCNYNLTTTDAWNYALDAEECLQELKFERLAVVDNLWTLSGTPLRITIPAHKVEKWQLFRTKKVK